MTDTLSITRRAILGLGLGVAAATAGCSRFGGGKAAEPTQAGTGTINFVWWGDAARAQSTEKMLDIFRKANAGYTVKTEYQDSGPYKDKLATRFAAGDPPDLHNQRRDSIREYADRGALLDLAAHSNLLKLGDIPESIRKVGEVGGKIYGISAGLNAVGIVVNKADAEKFGVTPPDGNKWSWEDYWTFSRAITKASGGKVYGTDFDFGTIQNLVVYVRQTGEELYNEDGTFGASEKTLTDWFAMSINERKTGGLPPAGFNEQLGSSASQSGLAKGVISSLVIPTNNMKAFNGVANGNLILNRMPGEVQGKRRGMAIDAAMYWSIAEKSKNRDGALKLLDFITNSVEGNVAVGATRGVAASTKVAEGMTSSLDKDDKTSVDYIVGLSKETLPVSRPDPIGGSQVAAAAATIGTEVMFGRVAPAEAAKQLIAKAKESLGKK